MGEAHRPLEPEGRGLTRNALDGRRSAKAVGQAAAAIDAILREQAASVGESRGDGTSILFVPPPGVCFEIFDDDRQVVVWDVWQFRRRSD